MAPVQTKNADEEPSTQRRVLLTAGLFLVIGCTPQWWRMQTLTASMDQGILMQVLWNGLRGWCCTGSNNANSNQTWRPWSQSRFTAPMQ